MPEGGGYSEETRAGLDTADSGGSVWLHWAVPVANRFL